MTWLAFAIGILVGCVIGVALTCWLAEKLDGGL